MINSKTAALCVVFTVFTASSLFSQTESVILYNSQPVKVELTNEGHIQSFIGLVAGYMEGYGLVAAPTDVAPIIVEEPILPTVTKNAGYAIISIERIELNYKPNFATLDKSIINELDKVAAKLKADPNSKILLTAHTLNQEKNKISTNRLASAIAYLGIKGVHPDRIQSEVQRSESLIDVLAINYLN